MKVLIVFALAIAAASAANLDFVSQPGFPEGRIINGQIATKGAAPYIVSLKTTSHFCAGSLISNDWVLTAAHCLTASSFSVVAGLHARNDESDAQVRKVTKADYIVHESYKGGVGPYDIGLIHLNEPFEFVPNRDNFAPVSPVALPSGKYSVAGKGQLFGWGRNNYGVLPNVLNYLDVNIIGYSECKSALPSTAPVAPSNVCSYTAGTADGACNGDSGGPLVRVEDDNVEIVGIVSWGYTPCATTTYPSVYTDVSTYKDWIAQKQALYPEGIIA